MFKHFHLFLPYFPSQLFLFISWFQIITIDFTICARKMVHIFSAFKLLPLVSLFVPGKWYIFFSPSNYYHWFHYSCQKNGIYFFRLQIITIGFAIRARKNGKLQKSLNIITIDFTICARKMVHIFFIFKLLPLVSPFVPEKWYIFFSPSNYYHRFRYLCQKEW